MNRPKTSVVIDTYRAASDVDVGAVSKQRLSGLVFAILDRQMKSRVFVLQTQSHTQTLGSLISR